MYNGKKVYSPEDLINIRLSQQNEDNTGQQEAQDEFEAYLKNKQATSDKLNQQEKSKQFIQNINNTSSIKEAKQQQQIQAEQINKTQERISKTTSKTSQTSSIKTNKQFKSIDKTVGFKPYYIILFLIPVVLSIFAFYFINNTNAEIVSADDQAVKSMIKKITDQSYEIFTINSEGLIEITQKLGINRNNLTSCVIAQKKTESTEYLVGIIKPQVDYHSKCMDQLINYKTSLLEDLTNQGLKGSEQYSIVNNMEIQANESYIVFIQDTGIHDKINSINTDLDSYQHGQYNYKKET